jgi:alanyl-tRNA synthetase
VILSPVVQVGDNGLLRSSSGALALVSDVKKAAGGRLFVHSAEVQSGALRVGDQVREAIS